MRLYSDKTPAYFVALFFTCLFFISCCTKRDKFIPPLVLNLSLEISGENYPVTFNANKALLQLPKYVSVPKFVLISALSVSNQSKATISQGSQVELIDNQLVFDAFNDIDHFTYQVDIKGSSLESFVKTTEARDIFSPRRYHSLTVFKDRLWLIGGGEYFDQSQTAISYDDIWSSSDGVNWSLESEHAEFPTRNAHATVVFKGKLWVISGQSITDSGEVDDLRDVWSSSDGINWIENPISPAFSKRHSQSVVEFRDKLWLIGGGQLYKGGGNDSLNDVWSSPDGIVWSQELENAAFSGRRLHNCLVYQNKLWVIGGEDGNYKQLNDVWSSPDGINWTQVTAVADFPPRSRFTSVVYNNKIWLFGGRSLIANDVWTSGDGKSWSQITSFGFDPFPIEWNKGVVYQDKIWIAGGTDLNSNHHGEIWFTTDGRSWGKKQKNFLPRQGQTTLVFNDKLWVIGGNTYYRSFNDVWSSSDGVIWEEKKPFSEKFDARTHHSSTVFKGKIWVSGGYDENKYKNDVWSSQDGSTWKQLSPNANFPARSEHVMLTYKAKLWVIGGVNDSGRKNDIWVSSDGTSWDKVQTSENIFSPRSGHTVNILNGKIWVIGGIDQSGKTLNDVWSSSNGIDWIKESSQAAFSPRAYYTTITYSGRIWIIGGNSNEQLTNDVWSSPDGINWTQEIENAEFSPRQFMSSALFNESFWVIGGRDSEGAVKGIWHSN